MDSEYPVVTIVMTTWFTDEERRDVAKATLLSWRNKLIYIGQVNLHIADDGSSVDWGKYAPDELWTRGEVSFSRQERHGVGASLNAGFKKAYETSPYVLYMVDDWLLLENFSLLPWLHLLKTREDVGCVRFGPPHPHLRGTIMPYTELWQGWAMKMDRYGLVVGHRPEIFHKRYTDYYGMWEEDINAQECERLASVKFADMPNGPDIVFALPHPWWHIDQKDLPSTSGVDPRG